MKLSLKLGLLDNMNLSKSLFCFGEYLRLIRIQVQGKERYIKASYKIRQK